MVMQFCNGGSLQRKLNEETKLSEELVVQLSQDLRSAFKVLSTTRIVHRDIKPDNILINTLQANNGVSDRLRFVVGDFGVSRFLTEQQMAHTVCGSPRYMAPEVIERHDYDNGCDLWSIGLVLYRCLTGAYPFVLKAHSKCASRQNMQSLPLHV